jgi:hypothetical protein
MMTWSSTRTLALGLALIAVTNTAALIGVAYNRGDTESTLHLTQRELAQPNRWRGAHENSGIALRLEWRVLAEEAADSHFFNTLYPGSGGAPPWLDKAKLETLGFATSQLETLGKRRDLPRAQLAKEVLLVLELDGPAYQASLERVRRYVESQAAKGIKEGTELKKILEAEQGANSRLFVVDAGLELAALRAKYPDLARYAIVRGQVQPQLRSENRASRLLGYISEISIHEINVPFEFRDVFEFAPQMGENYQPKPLPYDVTVNFGKRLEPWITAAIRK